MTHHFLVVHPVYTILNFARRVREARGSGFGTAWTVLQPGGEAYESLVGG
jgi:hypothetical protein